MKSTKDWIEKHHVIIFGGILLFTIVVRMIALGEIPQGLHVDEAGMAYDAYCYANYGVDRYLYPNPIYLINYGSGQSVLYMYLAALCIKIFGFSIITIRLPAAILGIITVILSYFIGKKYKSKNFGLLFMALVAICPWDIMQSRWGLDCNLMSALVFMGIYGMLIAKKWWHYVILGCIWGISLYTYALAHVAVPILLCVLAIYSLWTKKIKIKELLCMLFPIIIFAIPLILFHLVNMGMIPKIPVEWIGIPIIPDYRSSEFNIMNIFQIFLHPIQSLQELFGFDANDYNAFPLFGTIYYISIPFVIIGFLKGIKAIGKSIKEKTFHIDAVMTISFIVLYLSLKTVQNISINRINSIYVLLLYFIALGIVYVVKKKKQILIGIILAYTICATCFLYYYFGIYGKNNSNMSFNHDIIPLTQYLEKFEGKRIDIISYAVQPYIYTLLANRESPYDFNSTKQEPNTTKGDYGKYYYNYAEIHDDMVYAIKYPERKNTDFENKLKEVGFKQEEYLGYKIFYQ